MKLDLTTNPSAEDAKAISQGLVESNRDIIGETASPESAIEFSVFARDDEGSVIGGLRATCCWNMLHIELIWVSKQNRSNGIGTALLKTAERFAAEHGFEQVLLETADWQGKPFYEKLGYETIATLPEYPKGHSMHFMSKQLSTSPKSKTSVPGSTSS